MARTTLTALLAVLVFGLSACAMDGDRYEDREPVKQDGRSYGNGTVVD